MPIAAIGAVVGAAGSVGSAVAGGVAAGKAGDAAQAQANASLTASRENRAAAQGYADRGIAAAAPTAQELQMLSAQQGSAERATARQEALFASIDPAIMAAGKQALSLLNGQSSPLLNPMLQERQRERAALQGKLQSQLGSGYASSSAGSEALNRFDQQTTQTTAQVQNQTMGQLMGIAQGGVASEASSNAQTAGFYNPTLGAAAGIQNRQIGAYGQAASAIMGTNYSAQAGEAAGAPYVGGISQAQNMGQLFGNVGHLGATAMGYGLGKSASPDLGVPSSASGGSTLGAQRGGSSYMER